jgi:hypothetical protein
VIIANTKYQYQYRASIAHPRSVAYMVAYLYTAVIDGSLFFTKILMDCGSITNFATLAPLTGIVGDNSPLRPYQPRRLLFYNQFYN